MSSQYSLAGRITIALILLGIGWSWSLATSWWYVAIEVLVMYDLIDSGARLLLVRATTSETLRRNRWRPLRQPIVSDKTEGFAVLLSVYNLEDEMDEFLRRYSAIKPYTWIIDDQSSDKTFAALESRGWNVIRNKVNTNKPSAVKNLLQHLPSDIDVVLVSDPDTALVGPGQGVGRLLELADGLRHSKVDALCPQLVPNDRHWLGYLQKLEYLLSFRLGRASLGSHAATSGVSMYKRTALEETLDKHSLSVYAEDLENTHILLANNRRISYIDDFTFFTEAKVKFSDLFSQRSGWSYGLARVMLSRRKESRGIGNHGFLAFYQYRIYLRLLVFAFLPIRCAALVVLMCCALNGVDNFLFLNLIPETDWNAPGEIAAIYLKYTLLVGALALMTANKSSGRDAFWAVPLFVPYALYLIVPNLIGLLSWFSNSWFNRKIYRDHYEGAV